MYLEHLLRAGRAILATGLCGIILSLSAALYAAELTDVHKAKIETSLYSEIERSQFGEVIVVLKPDDMDMQSLELRKDNLSKLDWLNERRDLYTTGKNAFRQSVANSLSQIEIVRDYDELPILYLRIRSIDALKHILLSKHVANVFENLQHQTMLQQSLPHISQPESLSQGFWFGGEGATVAVLDTGVNFLHPSFDCTALATPAECAVTHAIDFAPNDSALDADGHGTNVAAIVHGVAPNVRIAALDVFDGASASTSDIIAAINWSIGHALADNIVAMNLSLGVRNLPFFSPCSTAYDTAFSNARAIGIVPVVSAGNDGFRNAISTPACSSNAVSVAAATDNDAIANFSNISSFTDLVAPGVDILAGGWEMDGTSQAAPHVAGAIALFGNNLTPAQKVAVLAASGLPVTDARPDNQNITLPRINLLGAVRLDGDGDGRFEFEDLCPFQPESDSPIPSYPVIDGCGDDGDQRLIAATLGPVMSTLLESPEVKLEPPGKVRGVEASDGTKSDFVKITWKPMESVIKYKIYRAEKKSDPFEKISRAKGSKAAKKDKTAKPGKTYFYKVQACNDDGCGELSRPDKGWLGT